MKKWSVLAVLLLIFFLATSGCADKNDTPTKPSESNSTEGSGSQSTVPDQSNESANNPSESSSSVEPNSSNTQSAPTQSYQDTLMDKIPLSVDMGLGFEHCDLTVNGEFRRVAVQYEMDSSVIPLDPCFTYYYVDIHGETLPAEVVAVGRAFLNEDTANFIRETEDPEELAFMNFQLFEYDFKAASFKGKDKEYIVFTIPASWEQNTSSMVIATDSGKLLADTIVDKSNQVTLSGDGAEKYKDHDGNTNFFSLSEDAITYLQVSDRVDGVTYLTEYALTIENDQVKSVETGNIYQTTDTVPDLPGLSTY